MDVELSADGMRAAGTAVVILLGLSIATLIYTDNSAAIYDIDTEEEWYTESGELFTGSAVAFQGGRLKISRYGRWTYPGFSTAANYRTRNVNASGKPVVLDTLKARGHIGSSPHEVRMGIVIHDCMKRPVAGKMEEYCGGRALYGFRALRAEGYKPDLGNLSVELMRPGTGDFEVTKQFEDIKADGYLHVMLSIAVNTTEPVEEFRKSYWDSIRLTGEPE